MSATDTTSDLFSVLSESIQNLSLGAFVHAVRSSPSQANKDLYLQRDDEQNHETLLDKAHAAFKRSLQEMAASTNEQQQQQQQQLSVEYQRARQQFDDSLGIFLLVLEATNQLNQDQLDALNESIDSIQDLDLRNQLQQWLDAAYNRNFEMREYLCLSLSLSLHFFSNAFQ